MTGFDTQALQNKQGRCLYLHNDDPDVPRESTMPEPERQAALKAAHAARIHQRDHQRRLKEGAE